ncbi:preprotein translocase subunit SecE [alpha proteobacterium AAP81b]|nr:preprotein translocase subunit SecE [alpha proteobacterium AAP81b]
MATLKGAAPVRAEPKKPRVSPGEFVQQVRTETRKVVWPTPAETMRMTVMVLIMTTILAVFFLGVDQVIGGFVRFLLSFAGTTA